MSTHPNVILMAVLTPQGLARQTMKAILHVDYSHDAAPQVTISGEDYDALVMESDYDESLQISAKEGDLVFYDLVTYGFGEVVTCASLEAQKTALEAWAKEMSVQHACDYRIDVTANFW